MKNKSIILVGGPHDGERQEWPETPGEWVMRPRSETDVEPVQGKSSTYIILGPIDPDGYRLAFHAPDGKNAVIPVEYQCTAEGAGPARRRNEQT